MGRVPQKMVIKVPASTANLGSGFDSIGIAFQLYLTIEVEVAEQTQFIWKSTELSTRPIPDEDNLILKGMKRVFCITNRNQPHFQVSVQSDIPLTRGLGSSASAYVAGLIAANEWLDKPLSDERLLWLATEEEGHPDNVGASIFGGVFIASTDWQKNHIHYHQQSFPDEWQWLAAIPSYPLSTSAAREILPKQYSKEEAIYNLSRFGVLVASLLTKNKQGMVMGLEDCWHQPYRQHLIPGFTKLLQERDQLGVMGFVISGAGPTVLALVQRDTEQLYILQKMKELLSVEDQLVEVRSLAVDGQGYTVEKHMVKSPQV